MYPIIAPSLLAADQMRMYEQIKLLENTGITQLHIDFMDGIFVPNVSFCLPFLESLRGITTQILDVHLMVEAPIRFVERVREAGADIITFNIEAAENPIKTLEKIKKTGAKAGVVIKQETPLAVITKEIEALSDVIQIMSVTPGLFHMPQPFLSESIEKLKALFLMRAHNGSSYAIEIDGGINIENLEMVLQAGADIVVIGSAIFRGDTARNIKMYKEVFLQYHRGE
ncbi:MAG: ribulose-phosphate 3-epimerase [Christensenellaceae bacterium]|jgi:ribulose-phosphate 3-epimerase